MLTPRYALIISPNEVFGDIMVLASRPRLPVDPDDVNTLNSKSILGMQILYEGRYPPKVLCYWNLIPSDD